MGVFRRTLALAVFVPLLGFIILLLTAARLRATSWDLGDVFVANASGQYKLLDGSGALKDSLPPTAPGGTARGCALDSSLNLWTVNAGSNQILKFAFETSSIAPGFPLSTSPLTSPQAIVFSDDGSFYVGFAGGTIQKYDSNGVAQGAPITLLQVDTMGAFWMDLASDQKTMFYSSGGQHIYTVDVSNGTQNNLFATVPASYGPTFKLYALRLLPPSLAVSAPTTGPGSLIGGLVVADGADIKLVDPFGTVVRAYDAAYGIEAQDNWFALALDPNDVVPATDRGFWAGDQVTGRLWHFPVGPMPGGPSTGGADAGPLLSSPPIGGLCVNGEPTQAQFTRILSFTAGTNVTQVARFNHQLGSGPTAFSPEEHRFAVTFSSLSGPTRVAVSAREVVSNGVPTLDSRDVDTGFVENFSGDPDPPIGVNYVHGRAVYYRAEALTSGTPDHTATISSAKNFDTLLAGAPTCQVGLTAVPRALRVLHDPSSDDGTPNGFQFETDLTTYFGIDEWEVGTDQGGSRWMTVFRCATGTSNIARPPNNRTFTRGQSLVIELDLFDGNGSPIQNANGGAHHIAVTVGVKNSNGTFIKTFGVNGLKFFKQVQPGIYRANLDLAPPAFQSKKTYVLSVSDFNNVNRTDLPLYSQRSVTFSIR